MLAAAGVAITAVLDRLGQLETLNTQPERPLSTVSISGFSAGREGISEWVGGEGAADAVRKRHLYFQAPGKVSIIGKSLDGLPLKEGARVRGPRKNAPMGDLIARLDNREIKAEIWAIEAEMAAARLEMEMAGTNLAQAGKMEILAKRRYERSRKMYELKAKSLSLFEEDEAAYRKAMAEAKTAAAGMHSASAGLKRLSAKLEQARIQLENTSLYAPFEGVVARLNIKVGDYFDPSVVNVNERSALLAAAPVTIIDPGEVEVSLNLPVLEGLGVKPGQNAVIAWGGMDWREVREMRGASSGAPGRDQPSLHGRVYSVSPVLDAVGRTVRIKVRAKQAGHALPSGILTTCWIEREKKPDALIVPNNCLMFQDDKAYIYVVDDGKAQRRNISIGLTDRDRVEVVEGLEEGEFAVAEGRKRLYDGCPVRIIKAEERGA